MAKTPSEKRTAKKKIPSTKFPKAKRKIASGKLSGETSKIASSKFGKAKSTESQVSATDTQLERPVDEQSRQDALAILKGRAEAMRSAGNQRKP